MATRTSSPEATGMDAFRASLSRNASCSRTLDRLCSAGQFRTISRGNEIRGHRHRDRLIFITGGAGKLIAATAKPRLSPEGVVQGAETASPRNKHILTFHFPGDFVPIMNEFDGDLRLAALTDLDLVVFESEHFLDVAQDDPEIIRTVLSRSFQALHRSQTKILEMGHKSARQRIAGFLVRMAQKVGGCAAGACEFALPMTRKDIADSLGLTIETVSRQFANLSKAKLIETHGRNGLRISNIARLNFEAG